MTRHVVLPRWPVWALAFVAVALVGLLLAFQQVVRGGVAQGVLWRQAQAAHADAVWRCKALRGPVARRQCLARLDNPSV